METNWVKVGERKPMKNGRYVICWAQPYTQDNMAIDTDYFYNGFFDREITGANYIAFWLDNLEIPFLDKVERNKLVK